MTVFEKGLITMGGCAVLTDDALWYAANAHFGRGLLIASIISIVALWILYSTQTLSPQTFLGASVVALVGPPAIASLAIARFVHRWKNQG